MNLEIWPKLKALLKTVRQFKSTHPLNRISWNFVVMKDMPIVMCRKAFLQEMLIWSFYPFWTLAKIILCNLDETGFLSDCLLLMLGIAIHWAIFEEKNCFPSPGSRFWNWPGSQVIFFFFEKMGKCKYMVWQICENADQGTDSHFQYCT